MRSFLATIAILFATAVNAQVIDVHLHAQSSDQAAATMLEAMKTAGVRNAIFIGTQSQLDQYRTWFAGSIPALIMPCEGGKTPNGGGTCYANGAEFPDLKWLRGEIEAGRIAMLGEITAQYAGIAPDDPRMEPYYALAEQLDIPVGIHLGIGPPGVAYDESRFPPRKSKNYKGTAGDPRLLEATLVRHPKLRLYVMHAAWPYLDDMLYMLYMHPRLYVDVSVLQYAIPRAEFERYLRVLMGAGFGERIMFGSDGGSKQLLAGVDAINSFDFLSGEQKRAILYENAKRFFRVKDLN